MDEQNIMTTDIEVYDNTEEFDSAESGSKFGEGVLIGGLAALVGGLAYKFIVKPIAGKIKAKKQTKEAGVELAVVDSEDVEESSKQVNSK